MNYFALNYKNQNEQFLTHVSFVLPLLNKYNCNLRKLKKGLINFNTIFDLFSKHNIDLDRVSTSVPDACIIQMSI